MLKKMLTLLDLGPGGFVSAALVALVRQTSCLDTAAVWYASSLALREATKKGTGKPKFSNIHIYHFHILESPHLDFSIFLVWGELIN